MTQHDAPHGSQHWLQVLVNDAPQLVEKPLFEFSESTSKNRGKSDNTSIRWKSPLAPKFEEYKDAAFLETLGVELNKMPLNQFWPRGGPVWDGLAKTDDERVFLIEAKAHIPEINTNPTGASGDSLELINKSLQQTRDFLNITNDVDWSKSFYQYTNRIAHLYLLRELNGIDAYLVNIYFTGDHIMRGPSSKDEWLGALKLLKSHLGILKTKLNPYMLDLFIEVGDLKKTTSPA